MERSIDRNSKCKGLIGVSNASNNLVLFLISYLKNDLSKQVRRLQML